MFNELDPLLNTQLRLAIMSVLVSVERAEFTYIQEKTGATSGNLSRQIDKLKNAGYITVRKGYKGNYPVTTCRITKAGLKAFHSHLNNLRSYFPGEEQG